MANFPNKLKEDDTIGVFSPSWCLSDDWDTGTIDTFKKAISNLESIGYKVKVHPQTYYTNGQLAGTDQQKADAFHDLLNDDSVHAIMASKGGYGCLSWLDKVDYNLVKKANKPIIGFSDCTALLNAIYAQTGIVTYHGPLVGYSFKQERPHTWQQFPNALAQTHTNWLKDTSAETVQTGEAEGTLIGGNFTVLNQLIGTPYFPNDENIILFIEDIGEEINDIDKYFTHLKNAGISPRIKGVIIGDTNLKDNKIPFGKTVPEIAAGFVDGPIVCNAPFGHGDETITLPIGAKAKLITTKNAVELQV